jgi:hypothetical protein
MPLYRWGVKAQSSGSVEVTQQIEGPCGRHWATGVTVTSPRCNQSSTDRGRARGSAPLSTLCGIPAAEQGSRQPLLRGHSDPPQLRAERCPLPAGHVSAGTPWGVGEAAVQGAAGPCLGIRPGLPSHFWLHTCWPVLWGSSGRGRGLLRVCVGVGHQ